MSKELVFRIVVIVVGILPAILAGLVIFAH
jgi:hypothetical protein